MGAAGKRTELPLERQHALRAAGSEPVDVKLMAVKIALVPRGLRAVRERERERFLPLLVEAARKRFSSDGMADASADQE